MDKERLPEAELITRSIAGDGEAFGALVEPYLGLFSAGIQRILQDTLDTQDALQEALLSIFKELHRFQGKSKFSTWGYRVCLNEALMLRRSRMRRREDTLEDFLPHFTPDGHHMGKEGLKDRDRLTFAALVLSDNEDVKPLSELLDDGRDFSLVLRVFFGGPDFSVHVCVFWGWFQIRVAQLARGNVPGAWPACAAWRIGKADKQFLKQ